MSRKEREKIALRTLPRLHSEAPATERLHWLSSRLVCLCFAALLGGVHGLSYLGRAPLVSFDEGWHARICLDMLQADEWWIYYYDGEPDPQVFKPPLVFWAMILSMKLLGPNEWAVRLFPALCFVGLVVVTTDFAYRLYRPRLTLLCTFFIATSHVLLFRHFGRAGAMDAPLALFLTLTMRAAWEIGQGRRAMWGSATFALALLTKSVAALQILPVILLWFICTRRWQKLPRISILLALAFIPFGIWLLIMENKLPGFASGMIGYDVVHRLADPVHGQTYKPLLYWSRLAKDLRPLLYSLAILGVIVPIVLRGSFRMSESLRNPHQRRDLWLLLALWSFVPILLFTVAKFQLLWYVLPSYVAIYLWFAWILGAGLERLRNGKRYVLYGAILISCLLHNGYKGTRDVFRHRRDDRDMRKAVVQILDQLRGRDADIFLLHSVPNSSMAFYLTREGIDYKPVEKVPSDTDLGAGNRQAWLVASADEPKEIAAAIEAVFAIHQNTGAYVLHGRHPVESSTPQHGKGVLGVRGKGGRWIVHGTGGWTATEAEDLASTQ